MQLICRKQNDSGFQNSLLRVLKDSQQKTVEINKNGLRILGNNHIRKESRIERSNKSNSLTKKSKR
jgi:hypothetical protein